MKEVKSPQVEIEVHNKKIDTSVFKKRSSAKTFNGWLIGKIKLARDEGNFEMVFLLSEIYKNYMEFEKTKSRALIEIEIVEGWKGTDSLDMIKGFENDFIIKSHQKDKETGDVHTYIHTIPFEQVNRILWLVGRLKINEKISYREIVPKIIKMYDLQVGLDAFNGGKNRASYYFPLYYYPVKILESLKLIKYFGRGSIKRLK